MTQRHARLCQIARKSRYTGIMRFPVFILGLAALLAGYVSFPAFAQSGRSDWDASDNSRVRLLLLPPDVNGKAAGGVEIQLEPGWHTYWQVPGEAGVPPQFDFSGSENIAQINVNYPVPERYEAYGTVSVIYKDRVVFPLDVEISDPTKPARLSVSLFYGACAVVCIPVKSSVVAMVAAESEPDPLARLAISEFQSRLPEAPKKGFSVEGAAVGESEVTIRAVVPPDSKHVDLFVKGPDDWYNGQPELVSLSNGRATFSLSTRGIPEGADISKKFDMLLVSGEKGILAKSVSVDRPN